MDVHCIIYEIEIPRMNMSHLSEKSTIQLAYKVQCKHITNQGIWLNA